MRRSDASPSGAVLAPEATMDHRSTLRSRTSRGSRRARPTPPSCSGQPAWRLSTWPWARPHCESPGARGARISGTRRHVRCFSSTHGGTPAERGVDVDYVSGDMRSLPWPAESLRPRDSAVYLLRVNFDDPGTGPASSRRGRYRVLPSRQGRGSSSRHSTTLLSCFPAWVPAVVVERDGDFIIDRSTFEPGTGRGVTYRPASVRWTVRQFTYSVRMFIGCRRAQGLAPHCWL